MAKAVEKLSVAETAEYLGITEQSVRKYLSPDGPIPTVREGRRVFIPKKKLEAFRNKQVKANGKIKNLGRRRNALETIS